MFIVALFTIARTWKQPKCPSTDEWIKKMWYIYTMQYYSVIKRNEVGSFVQTYFFLPSYSLLLPFQPYGLLGFHPHPKLAPDPETSEPLLPLP